MSNVKILKLYEKNTPLSFRVLEGLSTGCMMVTALVSKNVDTSDLFIYLFQWMGSFFFHVFPYVETMGWDYIGIQELIFTRISRLNPILSHVMRCLYIIYHLYPEYTGWNKDPTHMYFVYENAVMATFATICMGFYVGESILMYYLYSLLTMIIYQCKTWCTMYHYWRMASFMHTMFHIVLGVVVYLECKVSPTHQRMLPSTSCSVLSSCTTQYTFNALYTLYTSCLLMMGYKYLICFCSRTYLNKIQNVVSHFF